MSDETNLAPMIIVAAGDTSPNASFNALPTSSASSPAVTNIRTRVTSSFLPPTASTARTISAKIATACRCADVGWRRLPETGSIDVVPETKMKGPRRTAREYPNWAS
ncbi:hypothetical protein PHLCEN_2v662 [Hermanssonia centrifuga]|uniref:Uncharacterized protein n=1 Tax=Hermanssonia centrifuga TaxID=98765 RepID=A0A2R6S5C3_9APHY|nr:hypothetical protein PHLCEN_2v662 [Hermanssonia centrifuga]